jgi:FHA domain
VTSVCPDGHSSEASDYCDVCGLRISVPPNGGAPPDDDDIDTSTTPPSEPCPVCQTSRSGDDRFCEACGHDFREPPATLAAWEAVVCPDRTQFERVSGDALQFPADAPDRRFPLEGERVRIGRSQGRSDESVLEIEVADPGVSRLHAVLERRADGSYAVRDLGSSNGTTVGDGLAPVGTDTAVGLADGDVIRIGAWTTITVRSRRGLAAVRSRAG